MLLRLLGQAEYRAPLAALKPSQKVAKSQLMAIAQSLQAKGLVDYHSQIERFALTQRGRSLFRVEMAARPVTPDEWRIVQACRKGPIEVEQITDKVPQASRQGLISHLEQSGLVKVMRRGATDVQLTSVGQDFLWGYRPSGCQAVLSLDLLTNYLNFIASASADDVRAGIVEETTSADTTPKVKRNAQGQADEVKRMNQATAIA